MEVKGIVHGHTTNLTMIKLKLILMCFESIKNTDIIVSESRDIYKALISIKEIYSLKARLWL